MCVAVCFKFGFQKLCCIHKTTKTSDTLHLGSQLADLCWSVEQACIDPDLATLADALLVAAELETGHRVGRTDLATACRQAQELIHQVIDPKPGLGRELGGSVDPDDVPGDTTRCWIGSRPVCGIDAFGIWRGLSCCAVWFSYLQTNSSFPTYYAHHRRLAP